MADKTTLFPNHMDAVYTINQNSLYIGDFDSAINISNLQQNNISTIITMASNLPVSYVGCKFVMRHKVYTAVDDPNYNITKHFNESFLLIDKGLQLGSVLVHCAAGISRSATIVIAYLMKKNQWSFLKTYKSIKSKRKIVKPNSGFQKQLRLFQHQIKSNNSNKVPSITERKSLKSLVISRRKQSEIVLPSKGSSFKSVHVSSQFRISKSKPLRL